MVWRPGPRRPADHLWGLSGAPAGTCHPTTVSSPVDCRLAAPPATCDRSPIAAGTCGPAAPRGPPGPPPQRRPHLLVVLHEAADSLALHLPLGLLQLLPQLLLLALLMAVFLLPTVEAPHRVGPASRPPRVGSFAHRDSGGVSPDRPQTRDTSGQAEGPH